MNMSPVRTVITICALLFFLLSTPLAAKEFSINGKSDIALINTGIDNENISGYPPDFASEARIDLNGTFSELDFRSRFEMLYNRFDKTALRSMYLGFSKEDLLVELGNVRASFSEFTLLNRGLAGVVYAQDFYRGNLVMDDEFKNNIRLQLLKVPVTRRENLEEVMYLSRLNLPYFYKNRLTVVYGQTEKAIEYHERINFQNGRLSDRVVFQQAGYGLRFESQVTAYAHLALNLFAVTDDEKSVMRGIGPQADITPVSAKAGSVETRWKFLNDRWEFHTETARNVHNPNLYLGAANKRSDNAFKFELTSNTRLADCTIELKRVEPDYYTGGNQGTLASNDRQGVYSLFNLRPIAYNTFRARVNVYRDNLDARLPQTSLNSLYELNWFVTPPQWPSMSVTLRHNRETSDFAAAQITREKDNFTNYYGVNVTYPVEYLTFTAFYSYVDYNDRNTYSVNLARGDYQNRNLFLAAYANPVKDISVQLRYNRSRIDFNVTDYQTVDHRGGIFIAWNILPDKLTSTLELNYGKMSNPTYQVSHRDLRLGFDVILSEADNLMIEVKKDRDDYTPDDRLREYSATVGRIRYLRRF